MKTSLSVSEAPSERKQLTLHKATTASLAILGLGVFATAAAFVHAAGFHALLSGFSLLALSPYAVLCGACFLANRSPTRAFVTLVVCTLATACALFFYGDLIFLNPGSMSGLVFLLVPFYQLPAAILLLIAMFFIRWLGRNGPKA